MPSHLFNLFHYLSYKYCLLGRQKFCQLDSVIFLHSVQPLQLHCSNMADIISILSLITDVISLAANVYHMQSANKANVELAYHLSQKVRLIYSQLKLVQAHIDINTTDSVNHDNEDDDDDDALLTTDARTATTTLPTVRILQKEREAVLRDIEADVGMLKRTLHEIEAQRNDWILKRIFNSVAVETNLTKALSDAARCQQRIETHMMSDILKTHISDEIQNQVAQANIELFKYIDQLPTAKKMVDIFQTIPVDPDVNMDSMALMHHSSVTSFPRHTDQSEVEHTQFPSSDPRDSSSPPWREGTSVPSSTSVSPTSTLPSSRPIVPLLSKSKHGRKSKSPSANPGTLPISPTSPARNSRDTERSPWSSLFQGGRRRNSNSADSVHLGDRHRTSETMRSVHLQTSRRSSGLSSTSSLSLTSTSERNNDEWMVDELETQSLLLLSTIPDTIQVLIDEMSRAGLAHHERQRIIQRITNFWEGWRVHPDDLHHDVVNGFYNKIGEGATGAVYSGTLKVLDDPKNKNNTADAPVQIIPVAVKHVSISAEDDGQVNAAELLREVLIQLSVTHHCILRTFGLCWPGAFRSAEGSSSGLTGGDTSTAKVVTERMTCSVAEALRRGWMNSVCDKYCVLMDVGAALLYLHHHHIVHRDVKPDNVLLRFEETSDEGFGGQRRHLVGFAKLSDFGSSRRTERRRRERTYSLSSTGAGTPLFLPPEVLCQSDVSTSKSWDVWGYGLFVCAVLAPHHTMQINVFRAEQMARSGELGKKAREWASHIPDERMRRLAIRCLHDHPSKRPSMLHIHLYQCGKLDGLRAHDINAEDLVEHAKRLIKSTHTVQEQLEALIMFKEAATMGHPEAQDALIRFFRYCQQERRAAQAEEKRHRQQAADERHMKPPNKAGCENYDENKIDCINKEDKRHHSWLCLRSDDIDVDVDNFNTGRSIRSLRGRLGWLLTKNGVEDDNVYRPSGILSDDRDRCHTDDEISSDCCRSDLGVCNGDGPISSANQDEDHDDDNVSEDIRRLRAGARDGDLDKMYKLGWCAHNGLGMAKDSRLAVDWFKRGERGGHAPSMVALGTMYLHGDGVVENKVQALRLFRNAEQKGEPLGTFRLGLCYERGTGVEQDYTLAVKHFHEASEKGCSAAHVHLASLYNRGVMVERNIEECVRLLKLGAHKGHSVAAYRLAVRFESGDGVPRDINEALRLFKQSAMDGNRSALFKMGEMYQTGRYVKKDLKKTAEFYSLSAQAGSARAQWRLAWCFEHGHGINRNFVKALHYYIKAVESGCWQSGFW